MSEENTTTQNEDNTTPTNANNETETTNANNAETEQQPPASQQQEGTLKFTAVFSLCDEGTTFMEQSESMKLVMWQAEDYLSVAVAQCRKKLDLPEDANPTVQLMTAEEAAKGDAGTVLATKEDLEAAVKAKLGQQKEGSEGSDEVLLVVKRTRAARKATRAFTVSHDDATAEFTFEYDPAQSGLVEALKDAIRASLKGKCAALQQQGEDGGDAAPPRDFTPQADIDGEAVAFVADNALREVLHCSSTDAGAPPVALTLVFASDSGADKTLTRRIEVTSKLASDTNLNSSGGIDAKEFVFSYTLEQMALLESLKQEVRGELEIDPSVNIRLVYQATGDEIKGGAMLRDIFTQQPQPEEEGGENAAVVIKIDVEAVREAVKSDIEVLARMPSSNDEDAAEGTRFTFRHSSDAKSGLLSDLRATVKAELEIFSEDVQLNLFWVKASAEDTEGPEGEPVPITSDTQLTEILEQHYLGDDKKGAVLAIEAHEATKVVKSVLQLVTTCDGDDVDFDYAYDASDAEHNTLQAFKEAVVDALDLDSAAADLVIEVVIAGEASALNTDGRLRELQQLPMEEEGSSEEGAEPTKKRWRFTYRAETSAAERSVRAAASKRKVTIAVENTSNGEAAEFEFAFDLEQETLLGALVQEVKGELELFDVDTDTITLHTVDPESKQTVALASDAILRNMFSAEPAPERLDVYLSEVPRVTTRTVPMGVSYCKPANKDEEGGMPEILADEFDFAHSATMPQAVATLKARCLEVLEMDDDVDEARVTLLLLNDEGDVPIQTDGTLGDMVNVYLEAGERMMLKIVLADASEASVRQSDPNAAPARNPNQIDMPLSVYCEGVVREFAFPYVPGQATSVLESLQQECRGECDLAPGQEITILCKLDLEEDERIFREDKDLQEVIDLFLGKQRLPVMNLRVELGNIDQLGGTQINLDIEAGLIGRAATQTFNFKVGYDDDNILEKLALQLRVALALDANANIEITMSLEKGVDPQQLKDDDQIRDVAEMGHHGPTYVTARLLEEPPEDLAYKPSRQAELRALVSDWRDVLEDVDRVVSEDLRPIVMTYNENQQAKSLDAEEDPLRTYFKSWEEHNERTTYDLLYSLLESWTKHMSDEALSAFCHHGRETLDFMASVSPASRARRALSAAFRAHAIGGKVQKQFLQRSLSQSQCVDDQDIENVLADYPEQLTEPHFNEVMLYFFQEDPQQIHNVFSVAQGKRPSSAGRARRDRGVETLRKNRIRLDVKHSLDGVTPTHLQMLAEEFSGKAAAEGEDAAAPPVADEAFQQLAYCIAAILRLPVANTPDYAACWQWLLDQGKDDIAGPRLLHQMSNTGRCYASVNVMSNVYQIVSQRALDPPMLLVRSMTLCAFAQWCTGVAQLTCISNRWMWPPLVPAPTAGENGNGSAADNNRSPKRVQVASSPPRQNAAALVPVKPTQSGGRYEYRFHHVGQCLDLTNNRGEYDLRAMLQEQKEGSSPKKEEEEEQEKPKEEAEEDSTKKEEEEPNKNEEEAPKEDDPKPEEEKKPDEDSAKKDDDEEEKKAEEEAPKTEEEAKPTEEAETPKPADDDEKKDTTEATEEEPKKDNEEEAPKNENDAEDKKDVTETEEKEKVTDENTGKPDEEEAPPKAEEGEEAPKNDDAAEEKKDVTETEEKEKVTDENTTGNKPEEEPPKAEEGEAPAKTEEELKQEEEAATKIQAIQRQRQAKKEVEEKRRQKREAEEGETQPVPEAEEADNEKKEEAAADEKEHEKPNEDAPAAEDEKKPEDPDEKKDKEVAPKDE